jgi:thioredoxin-related protein
MKKIAATIMIAALCGVASAALPPGFTGDYEEALARAAKEKKTVLAIFSGSDWCPPCMALERNYLSKAEFTKSVSGDLVLLFVDSPRDKSYMTEKAKALNPQLFKKYGIRGVPTLMFLDSKGEKLAVAQRSGEKPAQWGRMLVEKAKAISKTGK